MPDRPDFEAEGMLEGLDGDARTARLRLLEQLYSEGIGLETLRAEVKAKRLPLLPADIAIGRETGQMTPREIAAQSDLEVEQLQGLITALGFPKPDPDQRTFGPEDLEAAQRFRRFLDAGIPPDRLLAVSRRVGSAAAQMAQAHRELIADGLIDPEADEYDAALSLREAATDLMPLGEDAAVYALRVHLLDQLRGDVIAATEPGWFGTGRSTEVSICFADLVGFTRLGERSELEQLGSVAKLLESVAIEVINPEVRLVKLIGDAAMLVSTDGAALMDAAVRFVDVGRDAGEELPALRVGVARGHAIPQGGDWFGHPVNLASRITEVARPDSVLAESSAVRAAGDGFRVSKVGEHRFKGLKKPVRLFRVRSRDEGRRRDR
jgi:adenylate cyclase